MKQISTAIKAFIKEYELTQTPDGVCFDAKVYIYTKNLSVKLNTEVHILTTSSLNADVIYLLNPDLAAKELPDMFDSRQNDFLFNRTDGLFIEGNTHKYGQYKIVIQPTDKSCIESTLEELQAKLNN